MLDVHKVDRARETYRAAELLTCQGCGAVSAPDGTCLEIGACARADSRATRGAARETAKYQVAPAAWTAGGRVD